MPVRHSSLLNREAGSHREMDKVDQQKAITPSGKLTARTVQGVVVGGDALLWCKRLGRLTRGRFVRDVLAGGNALAA